MRTLKQKKPGIIALIGPNAASCTTEIYEFGVELGKTLLDNDFWIVCGGRFGFMEAVCKGAHLSEKYTFGCTIGIIPQPDAHEANVYCDIVIPTGIGIMRNTLVVNTGQKVVAVAGGTGTLSEIAMAWQLGKEIICYHGFEGWARNLAGTSPDNRRTMPIRSADSLGAIIQALKS